MQIASDAARRLGQAIDQHRETIEHRWLEQVQKDIVRTPGVALTQLRDGIPDYLGALVKLLVAGRSEGFDDEAGSAWAGVAREHGITRVRIGFDISQLVHEFIVLRHIIADVVKGDVGTTEGPEALLGDLLDAATSAAVQAYVDARDAEARRAQAENIGFLTHELRNPLSAAMFTSSQLRAHVPPAQTRLVDALDRSLERLRDLVDSVLITEQLEAGAVVSHPVETELGPLMDGALEAACKLAGKKNVAFRATYDPRIKVRVDPLLTRSAIQNLADNAAKFTDAGEVEVTVEDRPDELAVHVRDTCGGISTEEIRTIFQPFKRGHTAKSGTGLGLAIARRAVEAQGGSIEVESSGPSGCHFWIRLPKRQASAGR